MINKYDIQTWTNLSFDLEMTKEISYFNNKILDTNKDQINFSGFFIVSDQQICTLVDVQANEYSQLAFNENLFFKYGFFIKKINLGNRKYIFYKNKIIIRDGRLFFQVCSNIENNILSFILNKFIDIKNSLKTKLIELKYGLIKLFKFKT